MFCSSSGRMGKIAIFCHSDRAIIEQSVNLILSVLELNNRSLSSLPVNAGLSRS